MEKDTLLIEIGTEELPPETLEKLGQAFFTNVTEALDKLEISYGESLIFAAPRRLGFMLKNTSSFQPNREIIKRGPKLSAAFKEGVPTKAALGFANSCGVPFDSLEHIETPQGTCLGITIQETGKNITTIIPDIFAKALQNLPISKRMRWGNRDDAFVRPVHWILALFGKAIIPIEAFGLKSSNQTHGHRFHHPESIMINNADDYRDILMKNNVVANFAERKAIIVEGIETLTKANNTQVQLDPILLNQVTGLVEWPVPLIASFEETFLAVPQEALISSMQYHQKCFPMLDKSGKLLNKFILISNTKAEDPQNIIHGNERVMHARLQDAKFFFEQDKKTPLSTRIEKLKTMVFQQKLGSLYDKTQRVAKIAEFISEKTSGDGALSKRAANLYKADLLTEMVGEFPELQGIMGSYYAHFEGENAEVANAIRESYLPRFSKDTLPESNTGIALALADRIDTLVGIYGIQPPTGEKDPFALRRQALAILRILIEKALPLDLLELLRLANENYGELFDKKHPETVLAFSFERFKTWFHEEGVSPKILEAVMMPLVTTIPYDFAQRIKAVNHFLSLPEAEALSAANKRVANILTKNGFILDNLSINPVNESLLVEPAEEKLNEQIADLQQLMQPLIAQGKYTEALSSLAKLKQPIDKFFDDVMVMDKDEALKSNRINLLSQLHNVLGQVANISKL